MRQLLHGPVREHNPGDDRVEEEDKRIGNTRRDTVPTLPTAGTEDGAAGGSSAAGGGKAPDLLLLAGKRSA
jgi:hypothetical protein